MASDIIKGIPLEVISQLVDPDDFKKLANDEKRFEVLAHNAKMYVKVRVEIYILFYITY